MLIQELWNKHPKEDIYVVGTGPSMRVFPWEFFQGKITIGLNQVFRHFIPTYMLTMHPELIPYELNLDTEWITKIKRTEEFSTKIREKVPNKVYLFENNRDIKLLEFARKKIKGKLYIGYGIHTGAMTLAAHMGAKNIILVGCDMCSLDDEYHTHHQRVRWLGMPEKTIYREYYLTARILRKTLRAYWKVNILNMNPFLGLNNYEEDYKHQKYKKGLEHLPEPYDESPYLRRKSRFKELNK